MRRFVTVTVLAALMAAGMTACRTLTWPSRTSGPVVEPTGLDEQTSLETPIPPPSGLLLSTEQRFPDVPLPQGLKKDAARTCVFELPNLQVGRMVYTTRASVTELAQFYLEECPAGNWERVSLLEADTVEIIFRKPGKRLTVTISEIGVGRGRMLALLMVPDTAAEPIRTGTGPTR